MDHSCPQTMPQGLKCEFDQALNVSLGASRERLLAGQSGNPAPCEWGKGEDVWFVLCSLCMALCSSQISCKTFLNIGITRRSLYFSWVIIYVPIMILMQACRVAKKTPTSQKSDGTKQRSLKKAAGTQDSPFLELWMCHMLCKIMLVNLKDEILFVWSSMRINTAIPL